MAEINPGTVYWVTGLAGAGKTTIARLLYQHLREQGPNVAFLDGDILREVYGDDLGHTAADRRQVAGRHARLCRMLARQGLDVVIATISMFDDVRQWNRDHIPNYCEVYLEVPMEELVRRDQKGLYTGGLAGDVTNVMGVDMAVELPQNPTVTLVNDGKQSPEDVLAECLEKLNLKR